MWAGRARFRRSLARRCGLHAAPAGRPELFRAQCRMPDAAPRAVYRGWWFRRGSAVRPVGGCGSVSEVAAGRIPERMDASGADIAGRIRGVVARLGCGRRCPVCPLVAPASAGSGLQPQFFSRSERWFQVGRPRLVLASAVFLEAVAHRVGPSGGPLRLWALPSDAALCRTAAGGVGRRSAFHGTDACARSRTL
ncbi:hypothetical protein D9M71_526590 [compost metagenome]